MNAKNVSYSDQDIQKKVAEIRSQFPLLAKRNGEGDLVYLDNAATTQKPLSVINRINDFYTHEYATVHRGVYQLSQEATDACDEVRRIVHHFINTPSVDEVVFVRGVTEAINLVAHGYVRKHLEPGDEILITTMEHHANIVPWQRVCEEYGFILKVAPINDDGELILDEFKALLTEKTKFVSVVHVSNSLGTINPVKEIIELVHDHGAKILIDGAQSVSHMPVDVQALDCDFYCFSSHKIFGPTGIGCLYGKMPLLESMDPYQSGGDMIETVSFEKTTYAKPPLKFEAGTPSITQIIGLGEAIKYIQSIGYDFIGVYEDQLLEKANEILLPMPGLRAIGTAKDKASVFSFVLDGIHPHDAGTIFDESHIAVRVGHHCTQPLMRRFKVPATIRASFSFYNTFEEIDKLAEGIKKAQEIMT